LASASLITIAIISITSLLIGMMFGMGLMFTSGMVTADSEQLGFGLIIVAILLFFILMMIAIVRNERKRARLLVKQQNGMF
jgi:hypothetical protein